MHVTESITKENVLRMYTLLWNTTKLKCNIMLLYRPVAMELSMQQQHIVDYVV